MIELTASSLGQRQRELNFKVAETVKKKICFDDIKSTEKNSDVDKLFKIDVASEYRNIAYIIEILKCGDSLLISRALNCDWIFNDEYSHFMNPDYLHNEVFPLMSIKMKTKLLNKLAYHLRKETRNEVFSNYCKNMKMKSLALKFFLFTSEAFKLNLIKEDCYYLSKHGYPPLFIGNSFALAEGYLTTEHYIFQKERFIDKLAYMYHVDENKYLDLLEKHVMPEHAFVPMGCRLSKYIMTKHKDRVLRLPLLYVNKVKRNILLRHSTTVDVKIYIPTLLPTLKRFWEYNFYAHNRDLFNFIPSDETYKFLKKIFHKRYGDVPFEMNYRFYYHEYHDFLTQEEKEQWALKHIEEAKEILGTNNDYIWYKFVNFTQAFPNIKKYILITPDTGMRNKMIMVLIDTIRTKEDLETLINYYYKRHNNENVNHKRDFLEGIIIETSFIFQCDEPTWNVFNKILCSIETATPGCNFCYLYKFYFAIHNIIRGIEMDSTLMDYIDESMDMNCLKCNLDDLNTDEQKSVYEYFYDYYYKKFKYSIKWDHDETRRSRNKYALYLKNLLQCFDKTKEYLPKEVLCFMNSTYCHFRYDDFLKDKKDEDKQKKSEKDPESPEYRLETLTDDCLLRLLKKDEEIKTIVELRPEIKSCFEQRTFGIRKFLKKLKIYYSQDLGSLFLEFFESCLANIQQLERNDFDDRKLIQNSVYAIFSIGNEENMLKLLLENVPKESKIDHSTIDKKLIAIQEAICRYACYARLPVPVSTILPYIKGDYVHFCLPMFNRYLANLTMPLCHEFIESILDAPLSVQKHGIRLAFTAFSAENLKNLLLNVWKNTKNVSLRMIIYKSLFDKIIKSNEDTQNELYDVIRELNLTLYDEDQKEVFDLLVSYEMPKRFKGDYLESAWISVKQLPNKTKNMTIKIKLLNDIEKHMDCMNREFVLKEIEDHIKIMLIEKGIEKTFTDVESSCNDCLWNVAARYIVASETLDDSSKSLQLLEIILRESYKQWSLISNNPYVVNKNSFIIIDNVKERSELSAYKFSKYNIQIFETILSCVLDLTPEREIYMTIMDLRILIISKKVITQENEDPDINRASKYVTKELVLFMNDLKNNNNCFTIFYNSIVTVITQTLLKMSSLLRINGHLLLAFVCKELLCMGGTDNTLLALSVMPLNISTTFDDERAEFKKLCLDFTKKVKDINLFEIQSFYYNKFVLDNFEKRFA
ncbi:uncharacterized protein LOC125059053 [Pieris napi]|uniref:uncharacterized protein LOC125059053 n=1 Tax=Pieris napi TaxID=78633 RepID=UPI001FBC1263|nr:uncharacterized protein LOC125059053 [Pieris napi]XP_047519197.1 uncharacterized protein LOC125059053 [Pieris napi]XP_047519198.1 uncharacterized protein LOC125059053 [Pieris napi]XP_047519199.1 uncharacterized protein LOC125059053 [Pieris napi]XP_047519200.1 uncharacterized protein LOC125059053 [Pieris napi]